jgi:hypothetical protein
MGIDYDKARAVLAQVRDEMIAAVARHACVQL